MSQWPQDFSDQANDAFEQVKAVFDIVSVADACAQSGSGADSGWWVDADPSQPLSTYLDIHRRKPMADIEQALLTGTFNDIPDYLIRACDIDVEHWQLDDPRAHRLLDDIGAQQDNGYYYMLSFLTLAYLAQGVRERWQGGYASCAAQLRADRDRTIDFVWDLYTGTRECEIFAREVAGESPQTKTPLTAGQSVVSLDAFRRARRKPTPPPFDLSTSVFSREAVKQAVSTYFSANRDPVSYAPAYADGWAHDIIDRLHRIHHRRMMLQKRAATFGGPQNPVI